MIRAGEGRCRPPWFGAVSGLQCIRVQHRVRPSACQRTTFKMLPEKLCRIQHQAHAPWSTSWPRRPPKVPRRVLRREGHPSGAQAGLLLGDRFGQALDAGNAKERMTRNGQARGDAPGALAAAISQAAVQIAEPGDDAHPRLEMPSPLALFGGLGSRLSLVAHMTEQGPGRWDEREFPDAPSLLSPKTTHRKITPRFPTSCLSRF